MMIIGMIIILAIIIAVFSKNIGEEAELTEKEFAVYLASQVNNAILKSLTFPGDSRVTLKINFAEPYNLRIKDNTIIISFPRKNISSTQPIYVGGINLINSDIDNVGEIIIAKKDRNVLISENIVCNTTDEKCDTGCIIEGECDILCEQTLELCNPYCNISNNVCNPNCYSNIDKGYYDIDCLKNNDNICDPATDLLSDGVCDNDCLGKNGVCDFDCSDQGRYDPDCPVERNGVCDVSFGDDCFGECKCNISNGEKCVKSCLDTNLTLNQYGCSALLHDNNICEQDCACSSGNCAEEYNEYGEKTGSTRICCPSGEFNINGVCKDIRGDNICLTKEPFFENCMNSPKDCSCKDPKPDCTVCPGLEYDEKGCTKLHTNGDVCNDSCQCSSRNCNNNHCCAKGFYWNGSACKDPYNDNICPTSSEDTGFPVSENCESNGKPNNDCYCGKTKTCCVNTTISKDEKGCINNTAKLNNGEKCDYDCECKSNYCDKRSKEGHCCPKVIGGIITNNNVVDN